MTNTKHYGRIFYGLGIVGIGLLHFFFKGFRPIIMPIPAESVADISILVHLIAMYILVSGLFICINKKTRDVSLLLGAFFFIFLLGGHLPVRLQHHSEIRGAWIDAIKILALSGGALLMASAYPRARPNKVFDALYKVAPVGKYFFVIMLLLFGYGHMVNAVNISRLVPDYIPWPVFWTYIGGIALLGSAISFVINFKVKIVALLLGLTLFIWLISLHLYYAIRFPEFQDGENIIGSFECLAFCGIALVISSPAVRANKVDIRLGPELKV